MCREKTMLLCFRLICIFTRLHDFYKYTICVCLYCSCCWCLLFMHPLWCFLWNPPGKSTQFLLICFWCLSWFEKDWNGMRSIVLWVNCLLKCEADLEIKIKWCKKAFIFFLYMSGWNCCNCVSVNWKTHCKKQWTTSTAGFNWGLFISDHWWSAVADIKHENTQNNAGEARREWGACPNQLFLLEVQKVFLQQNSVSCSATFLHRESGEKSKTAKKQTNFPLLMHCRSGSPMLLYMG